MPEAQKPTDLPPDTIADIRRLISRELVSAGVQDTDVEVSSGEDHDGDPAILVRITYRSGKEPFDGRAAARALFELNTMLGERGEQRFAYIYHRSEEADA